MDINNIVEAIKAGKAIPSQHSLSEAAEDILVLDEIYLSVVEGGEVIEDYPSAYPLPACLVLGWNATGEPIHTVWGYDRKKETARLITVYRPDPNRWINWRIRR